MATANTGVIQEEIRIEASPDAVFPFFTDPAKMVRWWGVSAVLDAAPGGNWRMNVDGQNVVGGRYLELDPPQRLVMSWGFDFENSPLPLGASTVEVTFTADGDGTLVRVVHRGLPELLQEIHAVGWAHYMRRIDVAATGGDPGPDTFPASAGEVILSLLDPSAAPGDTAPS